MHSIVIDTWKNELLQNDQGRKFIINGFHTVVSHYRRIHISLLNFEFKHNYVERGIPFLIGIGSPIDRINLKNILTIDSRTIVQMHSFQFFGEFNAQNITYQDIPDTDAALYINMIAKVSLKDISFINFTSNPQKPFSPLTISNTPASVVIIDTLRVENCTLHTLSLVKLISNPLSFEVKNAVYDNIVMDNHISLIELADISVVKISNHTVNNISLLSNAEASNVLINFKQLTLIDTSIILIEDIAIFSSEISFMTMGNLQNSTNMAKDFSVNNLSMKNAYLESSIALISTQGFDSSGGVNVKFHNLTISGIEFRTTAESIDFKHHLQNPVTISNSTFENITSGSISLKVHGNDKLTSKVLFNN